MDGGRLLVIGAGGAIGGAVRRLASARGWRVTGTGRGGPPPDLAPDTEWLRLDPAEPDRLAGLDGPVDAVCWAQGANLGDSLATFDAARHLELYRANCLSVLSSAATLVRHRLLTEAGARLVVVSSVWQERARQDKLSYTMTKAAIGGLVRAASVDLGRDGHLINAVLPGVLDTPMTAANLSPAQIEVVRGKTAAHRLPDLDGLAETILFLASPANTSLTGQSVAVDLGMSVASLV